MIIVLIVVSALIFIIVQMREHTMRPKRALFALIWVFAVLVFFSPHRLFAVYPAGGPHTFTGDPHKLDSSLFLDIECHSGTPPVLEFVLTDNHHAVQNVYFDFDGDGYIELASQGLRTEEEGKGVVFRGVPYRKKGRYTPVVWISTALGTFRREYTVCFTDFIWGRDNFCFANDGKFENAIDFVSKTVIDWAEERFGELTQEEEVLLLHTMYSIYKGSIGRCYGFTGGEVFYIENPGRVPFPYFNIYDMDELDSAIIKEMDFVQNDIVFANFISGKVDLDVRQSREDLAGEMEKIKRSIERGKPIILGYLSRKMHHSMVVYGYFENLFRSNLTLLTANNWEREQNTNSYSEDAENIVVKLKEESAEVRWFDLTKKKYRYPENLFAIAREKEYTLDPSTFFTMIEEKMERIREENITLLMVEMTEVAYVMDGEGKKRGYKKPRYYNEMKDIDFKKVDYNYIFEIPSGSQYTLVIKKARFNKEKNQKKEVNVFGVFPAEDGVESIVFSGVGVFDDRETKFTIGNSGIQLQE
jgi:hypothetical protein